MSKPINNTAYLNGSAFDLSSPMDISIPVTDNDPVNAFHLPKAVFAPFQMGDFIGSVEHGGPVRCDIVTFAPHGNGTHTECVGHIAGRGYSLHACLHKQIFTARLVSIPLTNNGTVSASGLEGALDTFNEEALVIRTLPNDESKRNRQWSGNTPPYVEADAMQLIVDMGVRHLLIDLPSVDPEEDNGALVSHHIFWNFPDEPRADCTITELIFVPNQIPDGLYMLSLNASAFDADAAPSRPTLFPVVED